MRVGKSGYLNVDTHSQCWERRLQGNGLAYGVEPYVSSLRKPRAASCTLTRLRFAWAAMVFRYSKLARAFLHKMCLRK